MWALKFAFPLFTQQTEQNWYVNKKKRFRERFKSHWKHAASSFTRELIAC